MVVLELVCWILLIRRVNSDTKGGLGNSADRLPRQSALAWEPSVTESSARDRLLDIASREPSRFMYFDG